MGLERGGGWMGEGVGFSRSSCGADVLRAAKAEEEGAGVASVFWPWG